MGKEKLKFLVQKVVFFGWRVWEPQTRLFVEELREVMAPLIGNRQPSVDWKPGQRGKNWWELGGWMRQGHTQRVLFT